MGHSVLDSMTLQTVKTDTRQSPRFKKFWKIRFGFKLSLGLLYELSFRIQAASYFELSLKKKRFNILFGGFSL